MNRKILQSIIIIFFFGLLGGASTDDNGNISGWVWPLGVLIVVALFVMFCIGHAQAETAREQIKDRVREYMKEADELVAETCSVGVVGIEYRTDQEQQSLCDAKVDDIVELIPEPDNKFDRYAVKVYFNNNHVGYIPKYLSREIANNTILLPPKLAE